MIYTNIYVNVLLVVYILNWLCVLLLQTLYTDCPQSPVLPEEVQSAAALYLERAMGRYVVYPGTVMRWYMCLQLGHIVLLISGSPRVWIPPKYRPSVCSFGRSLYADSFSLVGTRCLCCGKYQYMRSAHYNYNDWHT